MSRVVKVKLNYKRLVGLLVVLGMLLSLIYFFPRYEYHEIFNRLVESVQGPVVNP